MGDKSTSGRLAEFIRRHQGDILRGGGPVLGRLAVDEGSDLCEAVTELVRLRERVARSASAQFGSDGAQLTELNRAIDRAIVAAVERYVEEQERARRAAASRSAEELAAVEARFRAAMDRELVASHRRLEGALQKAQDAMRLREDVLAIVSHDLRSPLTAVHLAAQNLTDRIAEQDEKARRQIDVIVRSAERMDRLIGDLLDVASIEAGTLSLECRPYDAAGLVHEAVERHRDFARERAIALEARCSAHDSHVLCDRERVQQLLGNLVGNALKFCRAGDAVAVSCRADRGEVCFAVSDTGPGIPSHEMPLIFEPYWKSRRARASGTGLGLFISKAIVDAHGGRMWADSSPGAGTVVHFTLRLA